MANTSGIYADRYESHFASTLRAFMDRHPVTREKTTQKQLAEHLGVRPQTVSLYAVGESLPDCEKLLKIAEYFGCTCDFLMTGKVTEYAPIRETLGFSDETIACLKLVRDGYFADETPDMLAMLDALLSDKDFYLTLQRAAEHVHASKYSLTREISADAPEFYKWKAAQAMQDYFIHLMDTDFIALFERRSTYSGAHGDSGEQDAQDER